MGNLFGGGGGGSKGYTPPTTVDIPPFESAGGITPQQQDLAEYSYGENLLSPAALFGTEGIGQSTMATQAAGAERMAEAGQQGQMSDVNQGAQYNLYQNDIQGLTNNLTTQTTLENLQNNANQQSLAGTLSGLTSLAKAAGGGGTTGGATT